MKRRSIAVCKGSGFTIIELMVASGVLLIILVVLLQITGGMGEIWKSSVGKITTYQSARAAFATITRTVSRATLNTYFDYVDTTGAARSSSNAANFVPRGFARTSELHFLSGPTQELVSDATPERNPGHAIFFQIPLGESNNQQLSPLHQALNSVGFYVHYGPLDDSRLIPAWMQNLLGKSYRFRVVQLVEPTESLGVYQSSTNPTYSDNWLGFFSANRTEAVPRARVLAENVPLLVFRARVSPQDEEQIAGRFGLAYSPNVEGAILSPNYHYDSRAWQENYVGGRVPKQGASSYLPGIMRNQVPPIVDVAMVAIDERSIARLEAGETPPLALSVPDELFQDAAKLEEDLEAYSEQLSQSSIRHRIFRTSITMQTSKWSNF